MRHEADRLEKKSDAAGARREESLAVADASGLRGRVQAFSNATAAMQSKLVLVLSALLPWCRGVLILHFFESDRGHEDDDHTVTLFSRLRSGYKCALTVLCNQNAVWKRSNITVTCPLTLHVPIHDLGMGSVFVDIQATSLNTQDVFDVASISVPQLEPELQPESELHSEQILCGLLRAEMLLETVRKRRSMAQTRAFSVVPSRRHGWLRCTSMSSQELRNVCKVWWPRVKRWKLQIEASDRRRRER